MKSGILLENGNFNEYFGRVGFINENKLTCPAMHSFYKVLYSCLLLHAFFEDSHLTTGIFGFNQVLLIMDELKQKKSPNKYPDLYEFEFRVKVIRAHCLNRLHCYRNLEALREK